MSFVGFCNLTYTCTEMVVVNFNVPDIWPHYFSGAYLGNPWGDVFHIAHRHPLGGVDVPFGV